MTTLKAFLDTGHLGPLILGLAPNDVIAELGDPDDTSKKANPLQLKYGALQLVFWRSQREASSPHQLREIVLSFLPRVEPLPEVVAFSDFNCEKTPTERDFRAYMHDAHSLPVHLVDGESGRQYVYLSGVTVLFTDSLLHSIRLTQRETKESSPTPLSDEREPTRDQILEMLEEASVSLKSGAYRAALLVAWAGLEAALRRVALRAGLQGRIGVQPSVLLRELFAVGEITPDEHRLLEQLRQLRTATAHGLAPTALQVDEVHRVVEVAHRLLAGQGPSLRRRKELDYIIPVDAVEAYSILVNSKHYRPLVAFLESKRLIVNVVENAIGGDDPQHDLQVRKTIGSQAFRSVLNEWKSQYSS